MPISSLYSAELAPPRDECRHLPMVLRSLGVGLALIVALITGVADAATDRVPVRFVGSAICAECHSLEYGRWRGSDHDLAMAPATEESVLGAFDGREFTAHGVTSRFYREGNAYWVRTDGPDGQLHEYPIRYTFGWRPLQQYLIDGPGGRLQALGIAWDSRAVEAGGQRWFHLYPDEPMDSSSPLHWSAPDQNWNYQCAECHSTNLQKGYDLATDSFATTWSEIDVACEACHGPGSRHVEQARSATEDVSATWDDRKGLVLDLLDRDGASWSIDGETGLPRRSVAREKHTQIETCARCHSRRGQIRAPYVYGRPLGDTHRLAMLEPGLYHADGQILDEVYVYGSFIQSRMSHQGVTCGDCHDVHSLELKAPGDQVCAQCHPPARYATESHHHHESESTGASCIACHMPQRRYMVIDERADHSLRVPRPDLSLRIGTPNACNACHADKDARWAADATDRWYGDATAKRAHFGEALHAGRTDAPDAGRRLIALATDPEQPGIARASALDLLSERPSATDLLSVRRLLGEEDDLVRAAAVRYLDAADPQARLELGAPLLADPILAVRMDAAHVLAPLARFTLPEGLGERLEGALAEYREMQLVNAERPESHLNIGLIELASGQSGAAERAYRTALKLDPRFVPAYVNLADLYRSLGQDAEGEAVLRAGLEAVPDDADLYYALGLLQIRGNKLPGAVDSLARAVELAPERARYAYVHALAVQRTGDLPQALALLREALNRFPGDQDILVALVTFSQEAGDQDAAGDYARLLDQRSRGGED